MKMPRNIWKTRDPYVSFHCKFCITPGSEVLIDKLRAPHLVKKFPAILWNSTFHYSLQTATSSYPEPD